MKRTNRKLGISRVTLRSLTHARGGAKALVSGKTWCINPEEDPDKQKTKICPNTITCDLSDCTTCDPDLTQTL